MPRSKRESDEVYNARRRAKRLIARLERDQAKSSVSAAAQADYIKTLKSQIQNSYVQRKGSWFERSKSIEKSRQAGKTLTRMTKQAVGKRGEMSRANVMFSRQLNLSRIGGESVLGENAKVKTDVFYAATRQFWRGRDPKKRNELIMKGLGVSSLEEAFNIVLTQNEKALKEHIKTSTVRGRSDKNSEFSGEVGEDSEMKYDSRWVAFLNMFY